MPYLIIILAADTEAKCKSPHTIFLEYINNGKRKSILRFAVNGNIERKAMVIDVDSSTQILSDGVNVDAQC
jgi:hypothetical protein